VRKFIFSIFTALTFLFLIILFWLYSKFGHAGSFLIVNNFFNKHLAYFFLIVTHLGDGLFFVALSLLISYYSLKNGFLTFFSYLLSSLVSRIFKDIMFPEQIRPVKFFSEQNIPIQHLEEITLHSYQSFPSGHTLTAFAVYGILAYLYKTQYSHLFFVMVAILVGVSRIYLAQHFIRDVFAGTFLGYFSTLIVIYAIENSKIKNLLNHLPHKKLKQDKKE